MITSPGIYIVKPLDDKPTLKLSGEPTNTHLTFGEVLRVGDSLITEFGIKISPIAKIGDKVLFLTYDSGVDSFMEDNQKRFAVMFKDLREVYEQ